MSKLIIEVNGCKLVSTLTDNSSVAALKKLLADGSVTIDMHDFSNFEKVGDFPTELPINDEQIDTDYGDLILYLGKRFVIYYDKNSWNFTKLGHIDNITQNELKSILGDGDVTANLSLEK
ncbi:cyclophilin-like fold protein [Eggerthia catenaformis]|uniref:cyclophilin-like fold protein n=1 Tax=Eggerthia catenaformis TaxID=31973 RepID=UPI003C6EE75B